MNEVRIEDYVGRKKILTAEEVRKLPIGSKVELHSFGRHHEHIWLEMTVIKSGNKKMLVTWGFWGDKILKPIVTKDRQCYTLVYEGEQHEEP